MNAAEITRLRREVCLAVGELAQITEALDLAEEIGRLPLKADDGQDARALAEAFAGARDAAFQIETGMHGLWSTLNAAEKEATR